MNLLWLGGAPFHSSLFESMQALWREEVIPVLCTCPAPSVDVTFQEETVL